MSKSTSGPLTGDALSAKHHIDVNNHAVTFHDPATLGTAMAHDVPRHMPHPLHDDTSGHMPNTRRRDDAGAIAGNPGDRTAYSGGKGKI